jgi:hypothetical protein
VRTVVALAALLLAGCTTGSDPLELPTPTPPPGLACLAPADECPGAKPITLPGELEPVYKTIQKPVYEERRVPVWGEKTVQVYRMRRKPVTLTLPDPCTGCDRKIDLWSTKEKVEVGTKRVRACLGYHVQRVRVGSCPERVRVGWRVASDDAPCR